MSEDVGYRSCLLDQVCVQLVERTAIECWKAVRFHEACDTILSQQYPLSCLPYFRRGFAVLKCACACRENSGSPANIQDLLAWLPAMQLQASGKLEVALEVYNELLTSAETEEGNVPDEAVALLVAQASRAYVDLADWEGLEALFEHLEVNSCILRGLKFSNC